MKAMRLSDFDEPPVLIEEDVPSRVLGAVNCWFASTPSVSRRRNWSGIQRWQRNPIEKFKLINLETERRTGQWQIKMQKDLQPISAAMR